MMVEEPLSSEQVQRLIDAARGERDKGEASPWNDEFAHLEADAKRLLDLYRSLQVGHTFTPGQLVGWKDGLRNRSLPAAGSPAVVMEFLNAPLYDATERPESPYFREKLDLIVGVLDPEGDMLCFHVDSRRLEPWEVNEEE